MVSINTSTSFLGTKKLEESSSDTDITGLENIFASMLNVIEEENKSVDEHGESEHPGGMVGLLEKIKQEINLNSNHTTAGKSVENNSGVLPANVLQIYQTHKALIDEAIEIADESTISFDMERLLKTKLDQSSTATASQQKIETSTKSISVIKEEILPNSSIENLEESIEEFSTLEMQKIRSSMRQREIESLTLETNDKKKNLNSKITHDVSVDHLSGLSKTLNKKIMERDLSFAGQKNEDSKSTNQLTENSKIESFTTHSQQSNKLSPSSPLSSSQNLLNNQNLDQTYLKLLEKNWGKDLAKIIERAVVSGKEKININLEPQKLGKMQLTLSVVNNQTSIFISTENVAASLILSNAEERLAQMFESSGYKLSNFQANSEKKNNSGNNGSESKHNKDKENSQDKTDITISSKTESKISETGNGRKIINLIA